MLSRAADSLLLVVDIQERLAAAMPPAELARSLKAGAVLLQAAGALAVPVLATRQYPQGLGPLHDGIRAHLPSEAPVFDKTCFSCCGATGFLEAVQASGRQQVVLIGMEAHVCVLQTAAELHDQRLEVHVVEDAVCSRDPSHAANALVRLRQQGIQVSNSESVLFEWLRDAGHAQFKSLSRLIR